MAKRVGVDKWLFGVVLLLVLFGLVTVFSASAVMAQASLGSPYIDDGLIRTLEKGYIRHFRVLTTQSIRSIFLALRFSGVSMQRPTRWYPARVAFLYRELEF